MRSILLSTAVGLVAFLVSLDGFIVNVAIPTISGELGVREDIGTWIVTVFSMSSTLFIAMASWLVLRYGRIWMFFITTLLFAFFSLLCGLAPSFNALLIFRILQGATVGILTPLTLNLMIISFPSEKRGIAVGLWSFFVMVSPAMGPMIGGWLSNYLWRWMFFANIPLGILCAITVAILMRGEKQEIEKKPMDLVGIALIFICVATLQSALNRGQIDDWFRSSLITTLFIICGTSFFFFLVWEIYKKNPFIDLTNFQRLNFALPSFLMGCSMGVIFSSFILDSLWVQKVLGYTPFWAGLSLTPVGFFPIILYPIMGKIVGYLDRRIWLSISLFLYAITFFMLSRINLETPFSQLALTRLIQGIGFAMLTVPLALTAIEGVDKYKLPFVISLFSFCRVLCVGLFIPLATTLWIHREAFYQTRLTTRTFPENPIFKEVVETFQTLPVTHLQSDALTYNLITNQSWTLALADIYYLSGWIFLGLLCLVVFIRPAVKESQETR